MKDSKASPLELGREVPDVLRELLLGDVGITGQTLAPKSEMWIIFLGSTDSGKVKKGPGHVADS